MPYFSSILSKIEHILLNNHEFKAILALNSTKLIEIQRFRLKMQSLRIVKNNHKLPKNGQFMAKMSQKWLI